MAVHTMQELKQFQAMPLPVKVAMTQTRIRAWVDYYGKDGVYVSFSGGKDSTVASSRKGVISQYSCGIR